MINKIDLPVGISLDDAVNILKTYDLRKEHVYTYFNGHLLYSHAITLDNAYRIVMGMPKEEYDAKLEYYQQKDESEEELNRETLNICHNMVRESRKNGTSLTLYTIINGLKFICENRDMSQIPLVENLLNLGCNFSLEDIQNLDELEKFGATIIINTRDSYFGRSKVEDFYLENDDENSVYGYIRFVTGDDTYTKEILDTYLRR